MTDHRTVFTVVAMLGVFALVGLVGVIWLLSVHVPDGSIALVSGLTGTALGALGSMLVSTKSTADDPVEIVNPPGEVLDVQPPEEG